MLVRIRLKPLSKPRNPPVNTEIDAFNDPG
jgi:hypothetical protein